MIDMPDFILENSFFMVILWVVIFVLGIPLVWFGMVVFLMPIHMFVLFFRHFQPADEEEKWKISQVLLNVFIICFCTTMIIVWWMWLISLFERAS